LVAPGQALSRQAANAGRGGCDGKAGAAQRRGASTPEIAMTLMRLASFTLMAAALALGGPALAQAKKDDKAAREAEAKQFEKGDRLIEQYANEWDMFIGPTLRQEHDPKKAAAQIDGLTANQRGNLQKIECSPYASGKSLPQQVEARFKLKAQKYKDQLALSVSASCQSGHLAVAMGARQTRIK
jgi:hypothetical protein